MRNCTIGSLWMAALCTSSLSPHRLIHNGHLHKGGLTRNHDSGVGVGRSLVLVAPEEGRVKAPGDGQRHRQELIAAELDSQLDGNNAWMESSQTKSAQVRGP